MTDSTVGEWSVTDTQMEWLVTDSTDGEWLVTDTTDGVVGY